MVFRIDIDLSGLNQLFQGVEERVKTATQRGAAELAAATHAHILEMAQERLHSRRQMFVDALHFKQDNEGVFIISLDAKMRWIDDGMEPHDMKTALLASPKAKTSRDGSKYLVVPFNHGPGIGPTQQTPAQSSLQATIKTALKQAKIPYGKIEKGPDGKPLLGTLHQLNITDKPLKTQEGPGMGKGPIGQVRQGPTGIPFLQGIRISQHEVQKPGGGTTVKRSITTFRTVSSKMGDDRWKHPGLVPVRMMDEAYDWALNEWTTKIHPRLVSEIIGI